MAVFRDVINQCTQKEVFIHFDAPVSITGNVQTVVRIVGQGEGSQFDFSTFTSTPISGMINLTLTPTERPVMGHNESTSGSGLFFQHNQSVGFFASATATGSVVFGGFDYFAAAVASGAQFFDSVSYVNSGSMTIFK